MASLAEIREARGVVAELAAANPALRPVFDRLDREYKARVQDPMEKAASRARDLREIL